MSANVHGFPISSAPLKIVDHIQFGILSPEEIVSFLGLTVETNVSSKDWTSG